MELVSLQSVIDILYRRTYAFNDIGDFEDVRHEIESLPRSESAKEAFWKGIEIEGYTGGRPVYSLYECSGCGYETVDETDYCGNCGAKMAKEVIHSDSD
jgi:rubrerythrin